MIQLISPTSYSSEEEDKIGTIVSIVSQKLFWIDSAVFQWFVCWVFEAERIPTMWKWNNKSGPRGCH